MVAATPIVLEAAEREQLERRLTTVSTWRVEQFAGHDRADDTRCWRKREHFVGRGGVSAYEAEARSDREEGEGERDRESIQHNESSIVNWNWTVVLAVSRWQEGIP